MAIAVHSVTLSHVAGTSITISCDFSTTAYRYCLVATAGSWSGNPSSVTLGGDAMTSLVARDNGGMASSTWGKTGHKTGTQDIVVTFGGSCNNVITVYSLRNVDQSSPVYDSGWYEGSTGNPANIRGSVAGYWMIDSLAWVADSAAVSMAANSPQVDRHNYMYPTAYLGGASSTQIATTTTTTSTWTRTGVNDIWCQTAAVLKPSEAEDNGRRSHFVS